MSGLIAEASIGWAETKDREVLIAKRARKVNAYRSYRGIQDTLKSTYIIYLNIDNICTRILYYDIIISYYESSNLLLTGFTTDWLIIQWLWGYDTCVLHEICAMSMASPHGPTTIYIYIYTNIYDQKINYRKYSTIYAIRNKLDLHVCTTIWKPRRHSRLVVVLLQFLQPPKSCLQIETTTTTIK